MGLGLVCAVKQEMPLGVRRTCIDSCRARASLGHREVRVHVAVMCFG